MPLAPDLRPGVPRELLRFGFERVFEQAVVRILATLKKRARLSLLFVGDLLQCPELIE